jgi:predicted MPP superfamily phosphohydrolase
MHGGYRRQTRNSVLAFLTRRKFFAAAAAGALAVAADAAVFEPNDPQLVQIEIALERLPPVWDGLRIAQLSDFHYDPYFSVVPIRKAISVLNGLRPDLVVLTGDFVTVPFGRHQDRDSADVIDPCASLLAQLHAPLGRLAVLGNHDVISDPARIVSALETRGIPVLRNRSTSFVRAGARLWLAGIDDVLEGHANLQLTLAGIPPEEPVILLAHEPDFAVYTARFPVDLQLSGHSHGGQVRLPLLGAPVLPPLARRYPWGLHRLGGLTLYTNVGIGTIALPVRFLCPPEITLITLRVAGGMKSGGLRSSTIPHPEGGPRTGGTSAAVGAGKIGG